MKIGPFEVRDAQQIERIFDKYQIEYDFIADEEIKQVLLQEYHENVRHRTTGAVGTLDLRYIYFFISDTEYTNKITEELERFGIVL